MFQIERKCSGTKIVPNLTKTSQSEQKFFQIEQKMLSYKRNKKGAAQRTAQGTAQWTAKRTGKETTQGTVQGSAQGTSQGTHKILVSPCIFFSM